MNARIELTAPANAYWWQSQAGRQAVISMLALWQSLAPITPDRTSHRGWLVALKIG